MSSSEMDLAGEIEQAWGGFRARLADHIAAMEDDELLLVEMEGEDLEAGASPYLQLMGWGGDLVRVEAVSNSYLHERYALTADDEAALLDLGWLAPTYDVDEEPDSGSANFHLDVEVREADRLAVLMVDTLRGVYRCVHPAFLSADGLEVDPDAVPPAAPAPDEPDEPGAVFPESKEELQAAVDAALRVTLEEPLRHDDDGDVPIASGRSVLYVRVAGDQPAVDLYSELVVGIADLGRAAEEVAILNRSHPCAKFVVREGRVCLHYRLHAWPLVPVQLRTVVSSLLDEIDGIAQDLADRVGGRRFIAETAPVPGATVAAEGATSDDPHPGLVALVELLRDGYVPPRVVAAVFDGSRSDLVRQLVQLRTGQSSAEPHDPDLVLGHLRAGLRYVVEREAGLVPGDRKGGRGPRTRQLSLLPEREETLDTELWGHDLEESS